MLEGKRFVVTALKTRTKQAIMRGPSLAKAKLKDRRKQANNVNKNRPTVMGQKLRQSNSMVCSAEATTGAREKQLIADQY